MASDLNHRLHRLMAEVVANSHNGRLDEAEEVCHKIISMDKENVFAHVNLANILFLKGNVGNALKEYKYTLRLKPDDLVIKENFALALISKGMYDEAETGIKEILKINPNHSSAYNLLGNIYFYKRDFNSAKNYYEKAIELDSKLGDAWSNLGNVYFELGEFKKAEESYRHSVELNPKNPYWHGNLGKALLKQEKLELAVDSYKKALTINPGVDDIKKVLISIYIMLGERLEKEGNLEGASTIYKEVLGLDRKNIPLYHKLVGIKLALGLYADACSWYEICKKNNPSVGLTKYPNFTRFK